MNENSSVVWFRQPDEIDDPLTNILRSGARCVSAAVERGKCPDTAALLVCRLSQRFGAQQLEGA